MKAFMAEFKDFINKGNLLGIAVGFVMGVAFTALITAFVDYIVMPIIAIPFGEPNFDSVMVITVNDAEIRVGSFLTVAVTFVMIAFTVFVLLKAYNKATKGEATAPPNDIALLNGILAEMKGLRADMTSGSDGSGGSAGPAAG